MDALRRLFPLQLVAIALVLAVLPAALGVLGLAPAADDRDLIQSRFRSLLREAHPDHGGASADAAQRIRDLTEARRILLAR